MQNLNNQIWKSRISTSTKLKLYNTYILPVCLYGSVCWAVTKRVQSRHLSLFGHTARMLDEADVKKSSTASPWKTGDHSAEPESNDLSLNEATDMAQNHTRGN